MSVDRSTSSGCATCANDEVKGVTASPRHDGTTVLRCRVGCLAL